MYEEAAEQAEEGNQYEYNGNANAEGNNYNYAPEGYDMVYSEDIADVCGTILELEALS